MRLLLIEDEPAYAGLVLHWLSGWAITWVTTLRSALEVLQGPDTAAFDAILLDLQLPDSLKHLTVVRITEAIKTISVIVLTGDDTPETQLTVYGQGAVGFVSKLHTRGAALRAYIQQVIEAPRG